MDIERKLVTIRTVSNIEPIPNADAIEVVSVDGWNVVTKKGDFKLDDQCYYFEVDSFLPDGNPAWQFLVDKSSREFEGVKGHRLRTIKLRGTLSQGLVLPLSALSIPEGCEDIAEALGVKKWEATLAACLTGQAKGNFPSFIQRSDQIRAQNIISEIFMYEPKVVPAEGERPEIIVQPKASRDTKYEISMKLDGSSMTAYVKDGVVGVCSRNLDLKINEENSGNSFVQTLQNTELDKQLFRFYSEHGRNIALQGELMGPSIQGNREELKALKFFVYNVFDIDKHEFVSSKERMEIMSEFSSAIGHVPVLHEAVTLDELGITNIQELLKFAEGPSIKHPVREGLVFKRVDGQFSFKAISNLFLLKERD